MSGHDSETAPPHDKPFANADAFRH